MVCRYIMFCAKKRPSPDATTDLAARPPLSVSTSCRVLSAAVRPSGGTRVVVVVVGVVVVVVGEVVVVVVGGAVVVVAGGSVAAGDVGARPSWVSVDVGPRVGEAHPTRTRTRARAKTVRTWVEWYG